MASTDKEAFGNDQNSTQAPETTAENHTETDRDEKTSHSSTQQNKPKSEEPYEKVFLRVTKDDLFMIIALWMEDFVEDAPASHYKVGAVLVLPNDVIYAADCSRGGIHAVQRLLLKHHDKAKGCKMFMSRKPCPVCAKLLVQAKVERVLFLPFEPGYHRATQEKSKAEKTKRMTQNRQVDNMFTANAIAQTRFVLQVNKVLLETIDKEDTPEDKKIGVKEAQGKLIEKYDALKKGSNWMNSIRHMLPWPAFDKNIKKEVGDCFRETMGWIARIQVLRGKGLDVDFKLSELNPDKQPRPSIFDLTKEKTKWQAQKLMMIARFLGERTDDPKKVGVGAVIVNSKLEILGLGWNGFPFKAQYGDFGRASKSNTDVDDKKYPYIVHAEQNALLMRNSSNIEDRILFVTKTLCNECAPLIALQGIETVVVDDDVKDKKKPLEWNELGYNKFAEMVKNGDFICYQTKETLNVKPEYQKDVEPYKAIQAMFQSDSE